jgi:Flp pilus assembly protein TadG
VTAFHRLSRRAKAGSRGSTLIESVIVLPLFFLLVFGMLEFGFAFKDYLSLANGTRDGARTASTAGNQANADYLTLQAIQDATDAMNASAIQRIVIFHAAGPESTVPAGCAAGTATSGTGSPSFTGACNVYTSSSFNLTEAQFDCGGSGTAPDQFWCPTDRKVATSGSFGPPDYIGVWMRVRYDYITGLFPGGGMTFEDTTIIRIEPRVIQ